MPRGSSSNRRRFLQGIAFAGSCWLTPGVFAEKLTETSALTEGPFYPDRLPLDTDNDLLVINDSITPAVGEITHLTGRVLDATGAPLRNAFVELWQVDNQGAYLHSGSSNKERSDKNFQGYGRFLTGSTGEYYFRTIKPVPYPGRTPHIHVGVSRNGKRVLTTQLLINGHADNEGDGVFRDLRDEQARRTVLADFKPVAESKIGELSASFDIVLGVTAQESEEGGSMRAGIGRPEGFGGGRRPNRR
jgi:protocatechuate 3,4-dioxygenase beta subunit